MDDYEVVYAKIIKAKDFFDAMEKAQEEDNEILTVSKLPPETNNV